MIAQPSRFYSNRGYNLLEMVICLVVVGILSGGALTLYRNYNSLTVKAEIESGLNTLASAQQQYLSRNRTENPTNLSTAKLRPYLPNQAWPPGLSKPGLGTQIGTYPPTASYNGKTYTATDY